jgi:polysaccharide export outer membrane protein
MRNLPRMTGTAIFAGVLVMVTAVAGAVAAAGAQTTQDTFIREYKIGPRDLLEIKVVELPELNLTVRVSEDGSITLPLLGRVELGELSKDAAEQKIASMLQEKYVKNPQVSVFIKDYQSNRVALIGAVNKPGMYEIIGRMSLLELISKAGGFTENAGNEMFVMREGKSGLRANLTIDLNDLIMNGNQSLNIPLQPSDVVNVPIDRIIQIYVWGEVKNPGALAVRYSKKITLLQAIAQAGGTTDSAKRSGVVITRKDEKTGKETRMTVNLNEIMRGKKPNIMLMDGDVIFVPESFW